jgi:hypothetical protein
MEANMLRAPRFSLATLLTAGVVASLLAACVYAAHGEEPGEVKSVLTSQLERAKEQLAPTYTLAYQFEPGQEVRTKVTHLVTVETKIQGTLQTAKTRSVSTKLWRIKEVEPASGKIVFEHVVEHVDMWSSVSGRQEVRYDSATDEKPPPGFEHVATSVGKVLATVTMDRHGRILARTNSQPMFNPGIGELTIPFPSEPVKAGASWSIPEEVQVRLDDGTIKKIQTQQQYRLEKVEAGVATIQVATQILTPVNDPKIQSQLVQRVQRGTIKFDLDTGRLIHKQMDMDAEVFAFNGADSHMQYLARFTEEPADEPARTAQK